MPTCAGDSQRASPRGDVMRCLKLFVAREVFMTSSPNPACHSQDLPSRREACRFSPDPRFRAPVSTVSQATALLVSAGALLLAFASTLTTNGVSVIGWRLRQQLDLRDGGRSVLRLGISRGRAPSTCAFRRSAPLEHTNCSFPLFLYSVRLPSRACRDTNTHGLDVDSCVECLITSCTQWSQLRLLHRRIFQRTRSYWRRWIRRLRQMAPP
jgi:hypothetical protein